MEHAKAMIIAESVLRHLQPYCERIEVAGSLRRKKPEVKDIELVAIPKESEILMFIQACDQYEKVIGKYIQMIAHGIKVDLFMATKDNWGYIFCIRTGPAEFSRRVVGTWLPKHGWSCRGGYIYSREGQRISVLEEETLFGMMGLSVIYPEHRI